MRPLSAYFLILSMLSFSAQCADEIADISCNDLATVQANADRDDTTSQLELSKAYFSGNCVQKDAGQGSKWLNRAASLGDAVAEGYLSALLHQGGDEQDAVEVARRAAGKGDPQGALILAVQLEHGWGTAKDEFEAVKWAKISANKGNAGGQFTLGNMCLEGKGDIKKNMIEADTWYILALETSEHSKGGALPGIVEARKSVEAMMSSDQIHEAEKRASAWKPN